jgi:hypothetical protein
METTMTDKMKLDAAFDLVCPEKTAIRDHGQSFGLTWRDEIGQIVRDSELYAAGVTIGDVAEAVLFFTATTAKVTRYTIAASGGKTEEGGYLVTAKGYRSGPAGP